MFLPMRWLFTLGAFLLLAPSASHGQAIKRAYCGADATLHIVYVDGTKSSQHKEPSQVACDHIVVASDGHTVGWSVLEPNCCTSYPIPLSVAVLHNGRKRVIPADQMVWEWHFVGNAAKLAILSGPVHGNAALATLYDLRSGRKLVTWTGDGTPPTWASGWEEDLVPQNAPVSPTQ